MSPGVYVGQWKVEVESSAQMDLKTLPVPGNTCQNATRVPEQLDGDLRLAFAISHADLPRADSLRQLVSQVRPSEGWAFREVVEDAPIALFQELGGW